MNKIRTTINLNADVVNKAKELGLNISALAEEKLIERINELERIGGLIGRKVSSSKNKDNEEKVNNQTGVTFNSQSMDWVGFEPTASTLRRFFDPFICPKYSRRLLCKKVLILIL